MNNLFKAKEIINNTTYDKNNYPILVLGCFSMLEEYGENYEELIKTVFEKSKIIIGEDKLFNLMVKNDLPLENIYNNEKIDNEDTSCFAVSFQGDSCYFDNENRIIHEIGKPMIICSKDNASNNDILNYFVHEANHILKSMINTVVVEDDKFTIRTGFNTFSCKLKDNLSYYEEKHTTFDEIVNVLQTSDCLNHLKNINTWELDDRLLSFYNSLDIKNIDETKGYDYEVLLLKNLWVNDRFRNNIKDNSVLGNIDNVSNDFNFVLGCDVFDLYSLALDEVYDSFEDIDKVETISKELLNVNEIYKEKCHILEKKKTKTFKK